MQPDAGTVLTIANLFGKSEIGLLKSIVDYEDNLKEELHSRLVGAV